MFNWFYRWLFNRTRMLFKYWDGSSWVKADPIVLFRSIKTHPDCDVEAAIKGHLQGVDECTVQCVKAARDVFNLKTWNGKDGLTEDESLSILAKFQLYVDSLKKSTNGSQTTPESTEQPQQSSDTSYTPTKQLADFISTQNAQRSAMPEVSQPVSVDQCPSVPTST